MSELGNYCVRFFHLGLSVAVRKTLIAVLAVVVCDIAVLCAGRIFRLDHFQTVSELGNYRVHLSYLGIAVAVREILLAAQAVIISNVSVLRAGRS